MARPQYILGFQNGCVQAAVLNQALALGAYSDVGLHHWGGMRHAHVDEVPHTCMKRFPARDQIDASEFSGFGRTGMGGSDHLHERCSCADRVLVRVRIKRISGDDFAAGRQVSL